MSRYLLLLLLNIPFILAGITSAVVNYKLGHSTRTTFLLRITLWTAILSGLFLAEPIYIYLFSNELTQTEPLSLFDVVQITAIVFVLYIASRARSKVDTLERRVQDLHQELSIRLSTEKTPKE